MIYIMKLTELKEMIDNDIEFFWDAEVILSVRNWSKQINREIDSTLVDCGGEFYFLTDWQRQWKTKNFGEVHLW